MFGIRFVRVVGIMTVGAAFVLGTAAGSAKAADTARADEDEHDENWRRGGFQIGGPYGVVFGGGHGLRIGGRSGVQFGGGHGARFGGRHGVQFGGGHGARFGGPNGVQFGAGHGARFGGPDGVQFGGGAGAKFGSQQIGGTTMQTPPSITVHYPADAKGDLKIKLNDQEQTLTPGEMIELPADGRWTVHFERKPGRRQVHHTLSHGNYEFRRAARGWELRRAAAEPVPAPTLAPEPTVASEPKPEPAAPLPPPPSQ